VPVFRLGKQRFDPDLALVHSFVVGEGLVVALHPFQVVGVKRPMQLPTLVAGSTLRFDWTGIARSGTCPVFHFLRCVFYPRWQEWLPLRSKIAIVFGIVAELGGSVEGCHVLPIW
jgi:hypothetical protein